MLGWIVSIRVGDLSITTTTNLHVNIDESDKLDQALKRFREIETIAEPSVYGQMKNKCVKRIL